uniref:Protein SOGA1 n=1 Tax=Oryzias latipes TaxID=8090 RepID=A0A3P9IZ06_ORYLA
MTKDGDRSAKSALGSQTQPKTHKQISVQRKKRNEPSSKDAERCFSVKTNQREASVVTGAAGIQGKVVFPNVGACAQRKLSDASNASEDLSKDSGCASGKVSSSDSSSEISDCTSDDNKRASPSSDNDLSWIDGGAYETPGTRHDKPRAPGGVCALRRNAAGGDLRLVTSAGAIMDLMMGETTDHLMREVEDLRSENEYLKDEVEELRCEMLEMRDMFQEEEVYQLQELKLQLEQANKTCRILQYRLRKAERRSIRVAQTGLVDGELVRSLEHDIKVAKSVSFRLYNELEVVQKKNAQLEWENEALRERTQELEVANQVLQSEGEKAREISLKKRSVKSPGTKAERRLSQQMEEDSADLKCQLHFAKEELSLMCKKLTKLVSESEAMREELAKYQMGFSGAEAAQSPEGRQNCALAREAEVKVHLKLVEEEAMLLSRRIVELEVENRGLRAEMSNLREKVEGGGGEEEDALVENRSVNVQQKDGEGSACESEEGKGGQAPAVGHVTRDGHVGGDSANSQESEKNKNIKEKLKRMTVKDYETLVALRDHSCILTSVIQLLKTPLRNGHSSPPSCAPTSPLDLSSNGKFHGPLNEALELLQTMLVAFTRRMKRLLGEQGECKSSAHKDGGAGNSAAESIKESQMKHESMELCTAEGEPNAKQEEETDTESCGDPTMRLSLQILWILHQWWNFKGLGVEGKEGRDKALPVLLGLLQDLSAELQDSSKAAVTPGQKAERSISNVFHDGGLTELHRNRSSKGEQPKRLFPPHGSRRKNWCYLNQEAAQVDREDPVKTWDHLIMPLSFPDLNLQQASTRRSNTAPEKSGVRIYYSPPSARRVQLAQLKSQSAERGSGDTSSPWFTPPTSMTQICLGSSANLSDDMKEMTAGWRQAVRGGSQRRGRVVGRCVDVACSGTQTQTEPQMVSVGQQTDGTPGSVVRSSPSRVPGSSLLSARPQNISASLDGIASRVERSRTSSPKLYRRHSSLPLSTSLTSSTPKDQTLWSLSRQNHSGLRSGPGQNSSTKPPSRSAGTNRCGLVTEFLRRVSGRADKTAPESGQKGKGGAKNLERVPPKPHAAALHRNDSVTRIVNQRFMKQREETSRAQGEDKGSGPSHRTRQSSSTVTTEEGSYECSSSSTLTFCFARPSRCSQRPTSAPGKLYKHKYSAPARAAADSNIG